MIIGRSSELGQLGNYYDREKSQILVVYGQKYIGKTALLKEFMSDKPGFFYSCQPASEREQKYRFGLYLAALGIKSLKYPEFKDVFAAFGKTHTQKKVIVFDEFQNLIKSCPDFIDELISFMHDSWNNQEYLVILSSSSVGFIENGLISKIGESAFELSGFLKVKELSFNNLRDYFSLYSNEECAVVWSILGGVPGLWKMFDSKLSVKDNIIKNIIAKEGPLSNVAKELISDELRETAIYNTILASISDGKKKLNDLYDHTGFSRAKISVYIKNLMELELVKKVFSVESDGKENSLKGIYDISNKLVDFYFSFLYKYAAFLDFESPEEFYNLRVLPTLKSYTGKYFEEICKEYLMLQNDRSRLPIKAVKFGKWLGKQGNIDVVATSESGENIIAGCIYDKAMFTYADYEWLIYCASKAKIEADYIYLFAGTRFDEKITLEGKVRNNLKLFLLDNI